MNVLPRFSLLVAALLAVLTLCTPAGGQTANSDPVGILTLPIAPASVAGGTQLSFRALGLARPVADQGIATETGANLLKAAGSTWTDGVFEGSHGAHYVEIIGPAGAAGLGTTYDITATDGTSKTIQLAQKLAGGVAAGATFCIRPHWTIASVFGPADESGLSAGTASTADTIRILNALTQVYTTYFYSTGGWRKVDGAEAPQDDAVIYPEDGLLITRRQPDPLTLVLVGAVKTGQTSFPVLPGLNILANPYAAPMTLASSVLHTGVNTTGLIGGTASTADLVRIYNGTSYDTYYYSTKGGPGIGWRQVGKSAIDQRAVPLPVGAGFLIERRSGAAFDWVAPQHPAGF